MKNKFYIGRTAQIELPRGGCLFINDTVLNLPDWRHPRTFDPQTSCFNPLAALDYRKSCDIVDIFDALFSRGESTLTKDTGLDYISDVLELKPKNFDELLSLIGKSTKTSPPGQIWAYSKVRRILRSPVLSKVFCGRPNFTFKKGSMHQARLDWSELGSFDALALGLFLIAQYHGQLVMPHFARYARPFHISLMYENRLIAGVQTLSQLDDRLRDMAMTCEIVGRGCTYSDAVALAENAGHRPDREREDNPYNEYIDAAMAA